MRRAVRLAMKLYPAAWRERYGREFEALLEDVRPGGRELWDVVRGAMQMQMLAWNWRKTAAAFGLAGAACAAVVAARMPNQYISTAVVRIPAGQDSLRRLQIAQGDVLSGYSLAEVISRYDLYPGERKQLPLEDIVQAMRNRYIHIARTGDAFALSFQYPDRAIAQRVTKDLTDRFVEVTGSGRMPMTLEVLDSASLPEHPAMPNRPAIVAIGLMVGLSLGLLLLGVRRWPAVAACGAAAALAALAIAFLIPDRWISTAVLQLDPGADVSRLLRDSFTDDALGRIVQHSNLYARDLERARLSDVVRRMRDHDLHITPLRDVDGKYANAFAISFMASDRFNAQAVVRMLVTRVAEENVAEVRVHAQRPVNLMVLDPASLPERPSEPNRLVILMLGLLLGLTGGIVLVRRRRPKALVTTVA